MSLVSPVTSLVATALGGVLILFNFVMGRRPRRPNPIVATLASVSGTVAGSVAALIAAFLLFSNFS